MRFRCFIFLLVLVFILTPTRPAKAATVGDALLTVGVSTAAGAVLGLSTLPFYAESSEHTRNIFYGAALGAVTGVLVMAYAGFQDSADAAYDQDQARLHKDDQYYLARVSAAMQTPKLVQPSFNTLVYTNFYEARF